MNEAEYLMKNYGDNSAGIPTPHPLNVKPAVSYGMIT